MIEEYRVVVIGSSIGNCSDVNLQFVSVNFADGADPTESESYRMELEVDNKPCNIEIISNLGTELYKCCLDIVLRSGQGYLYLLDLSDEKAVHEMREMWSRILQVKDLDSTDYFPMVIVACRHHVADLEWVSRDLDAQQFAKERGLSYINLESSNKTAIQSCFEQAVRDIRKYDQEEEPEKMTAPLTQHFVAPASVPSSSSSEKERHHAKCLIM